MLQDSEHIRVSVKEVEPQYEVISAQSPCLSVGSSIAFTIHNGKVGMTRVGKLVAMAGSKSGLIGFQVDPLDEKGRFTLWVPKEALLNHRPSVDTDRRMFCFGY
jgi:hypothetical protein